MTNDKVPEERKPEYKEIITMLEQAYGKPIRVSPERQAQALARARERLGFTDSESPPATFESSPIDFAGARINEEPEPHQRGFLRLISLIAAVLVIGALIVSSLLVFQVHQPTTVTTAPLASPIGPVGQPVTMQTQAHGLVATLRITPGPYFLGELLEMQLSLTNHSSNAYQLSGQSEESCAPHFSGELYASMTGGVNDAHLQHNLRLFSNCLGNVLPVPDLSSNQTVSFVGDTVLAASGHIILTPSLRLGQLQKVAKNVYVVLQDSDPLAGKWPSAQITVQAGIPSDRLITGQQRGTQVTITAPPPARGQLVYTEVVGCQDTGSGQGGRLDTTVLQRPSSCGNTVPPRPNKIELWAYAVGAPGYSVVAGSVKG